MELKGISIKNFKAIHNHRFRLGKLNLFMGRNGMGKSSTLQAMLVLRASAIPQGINIFLRPPNNQFTWPINLNLASRELDLGETSDVFTKFSQDDKLVFEVETESGLMVAEFENENRRQDYFAGRITIPEGSSGFTLDLFSNNFQYLKAERIAPNHYYPTSSIEVERNGNIGENGQFAAHYLHIFADRLIDKTLSIEASTFKLIDQVSAYLSLLGSKMRIRTDRPAGTNQISMHYEIFRADGVFSDSFKPQNAGFGITYSLPVITTLLAGKEGKVQFIENPESDLHPRGQAIVGELLAKAASTGQQLFVETHSDHIVNGIRVAVKKGILQPNDLALHFFGNGKNGLEISEIQIDKNGELSNYPTDFLDEWDNQLLKLI